METFTPPPADLAAEYPISSDLSPHGTTGPVGSSFSNYQYPIMSKQSLFRFSKFFTFVILADDGCFRRAGHFFRGWNAIGVASNPQPNAGNATGAFYSTVSLDAKNQSRSTASDAYYRPIVGKRPNFHLITGQSVTKINLNHKRRATSVNVGRIKPTKSTI
jgi:hypothetical protein